MRKALGRAAVCVSGCWLAGTDSLSSSDCSKEELQWQHSGFHYGLLVLFRE